MVSKFKQLNHQNLIKHILGKYRRWATHMALSRKNPFFFCPRLNNCQNIETKRLDSSNASLFTGCPNKYVNSVTTFISSSIHAVLFHVHNYCSTPAYTNIENAWSWEIIKLLSTIFAKLVHISIYLIKKMVLIYLISSSIFKI